MVWRVQRRVVAYLLLAGAVLTGVELDRQHFRALHLSVHSCLHRRAFPGALLLSQVSQLYADCFSKSEDELIPSWVYPHPVPPGAPAVPAHAGQPSAPSPSPAGCERLPTSFACDLSGPVGLHEARGTMPTG